MVMHACMFYGFIAIPDVFRVVSISKVVLINYHKLSIFVQIKQCMANKRFCEFFIKGQVNGFS